MAEEPAWGIRRDEIGTYGVGKMDDGKHVRVVLREAQVGQDEPDPAEAERLGVQLQDGHGAEQVGGRMAVVAHHGWTRTDRCPNVFQPAFLADPCFVLEPDLNRLACG